MTISTFILAIALVESGNNPRAVGKAGELSEYQITERVWMRYANTVGPFTRKNAGNRIKSRYVAFCHAEELSQKYKASSSQVAKLSPSEKRVYEYKLVTICAAGWHRGEAYMKRPISRWSAETRDYADRVWNTYEQLKKEGK